MKILHLNDILENQGLMKGVIDSIKTGAIFIYPTDTVYGIGCNAEIKKSVLKIREIKTLWDTATSTILITLDCNYI